MADNNLSAWLANELENRGWSARELARRAGVSHTPIAKALTGETRPSSDVCLGIARALGKQPEYVLRLAGHLPPLPPEVVEAREADRLLHLMTPERRRIALDILRGLVGQPDPPVLPRSRGSMIQDLPEMPPIPEEAMERALDWWSEVLHLAPDVAQPVLARLLYLAAEWYGHDQDVKKLIEDILRDENIADSVKKKIIEVMQESRREE